ncbi:MAG TPA: cob(I)yrinic acid a,c-diamide adenosyltransferase [Roseateles sp.]|nr:cob(I)yrinic acid a,c-diamide adenosyltransferase [Roseateles sp.]HWT54460.1 cob(I)yrinic acid a,c-diamide adenosyltransferase [Rhodocyclaceae bacterium]
MTDSQNSEKEERHKARMARKKAVIDEKIETATTERGVLVINTGNGKGKSSAAFGVVARALGHGLKVGVVQFIKSRSDTGEEAFFRKQPDVQWHVGGEGFTWETQDNNRDLLAARAAWEVALKHLRNPEIGLVVLDEFTYTLKYKWLTLDEVTAALKARPPMQHVILTGRAAPAELVELADTVSDMTLIKHAFHAGVAAMPGLEW